jgi:argininosuccinate lyase
VELASIPETAGRELLAFLLELQQQPDSFAASAARGDIYTNREAWLCERTSAVGWLGAGRARREAITTAFVLVMRKALLSFEHALVQLGEVIVERAYDHQASIMPDYTYLQAAQPTSFGHYLLSLAYPLIRDLERLDLLFRQLNLSPMGCGSTNGSKIPQGRLQTANLLGFAGIVEHARDAMWQTDLCINCASILNSCSITLSRLAEDLQIFSTQEFGLFELDDRHARASKIMPQKKNPFALTYVRAFANEAIGLLATVAATSRTPTGQPDNRLLIYGKLPEAVQRAAQVTMLMGEVLEGLKFIAERGRELVDTGWTFSTDLAEMLVLECGLDFRSAHQLVGFLAGEYRNASIHDLSAHTIIALCKQRLGRQIKLTQAQLDAVFDPDIAIASRTDPGGTANNCMETMLNECSARLAGFGKTVVKRRDFLDLREKKLLMLAEALAKS